MIQKMFLDTLEISITSSAVILFLCIISPILQKRYNARLSYYIWLGIAIRLLIPISFTIPDAPIQINTQQVFQQPETWKTFIPSEIVINSEVQSHTSESIALNPDFSLLQIATAVWIAGACIFVVYHLLQYWYFIKRIKRWSLGANSEQKNVLEKLEDDLEIKRKAALSRCGIIQSPMMLGIIHPTVLIPCIEYSKMELYLILKHELLHYKQHDIEVKVILFLAQALYWFNPFVHIMAKKFNQTIEMSCDEFVISGDDVIYKKIYMETILESIKYKTRGTSIFTSNYNGGMKVMKKRFRSIIHSGNKKKGLAALVLFMVALLGVSFLVGCNSTTAVLNNDKVVPSTANTGVQADNLAQPAQDETLESQNINDKIAGVYAESIRNKELEKIIIDYLEIPDDYLEKTKYYYNYVDLNGDGHDEIFTVVMGPYTSGTGGSTGLYVIQKASGELDVNQSLSLMRTPIIISDKVTNGYKELIVMRSGGGVESNYVVLKVKDGKYTNVNDGEVIEDLKQITGTAIICNDIVKDMEEGKSLYLK